VLYFRYFCSFRYSHSHQPDDPRWARSDSSPEKFSAIASALVSAADGPELLNGKHGKDDRPLRR
jgi:hypothetical protein